MANRDDLIAQFIEISGGDENIARFYLSSSEWSLEDALSNFLGSQNDVSNDIPEPSGRNLGENSQSTNPRKSPNEAEDFVEQSTAKPKFATLSDMTKKSTNEEDGQAFYAGGSERSGQQVLGPPKRRNFREHLTDMFRAAQEEREDHVPSTSTGASWGQGMRLGMTNNDHTAVGESKDASKEKKPAVVLKLWSQGFSVDDGELRSYDDPENKEFLETVMRGEIPPELLKIGWMVNVDVEDHRQEDYKKAGPVKTFGGPGHTLGSPVPNIQEANSTGKTSKPDDKTDQAAANNNESLAKLKLNVNPAEEVTTLQIRLSDGSRLTTQFNMTHTIADIQEYIQNARPQYANVNFTLVSSFPTRELNDDSATIGEANLKNASLLQRLK